MSFDIFILSFCARLPCFLSLSPSPSLSLSCRLFLFLFLFVLSLARRPPPAQQQRARLSGGFVCMHMHIYGHDITARHPITGARRNEEHRRRRMRPQQQPRTMVLEDKTGKQARDYEIPRVPRITAFQLARGNLGDFRVKLVSYRISSTVGQKFKYGRSPWRCAAGKCNLNVHITK